MFRGWVLEEFCELAVKEGGDAMTAKQMWRSGCTEGLVQKAREAGLTFKDLEEIYGTFGQNSMPVVIEVISRIKK
jgi:hypothetical protein